MTEPSIKAGNESQTPEGFQVAGLSRAWHPELLLHLGLVFWIILVHAILVVALQPVMTQWDSRQRQELESTARQVASQLTTYLRELVRLTRGIPGETELQKALERSLGAKVTPEQVSSFSRNLLEQHLSSRAQLTGLVRMDARGNVLVRLGKDHGSQFCDTPSGQQRLQPLFRQALITQSGLSVVGTCVLRPDGQGGYQRDVVFYGLAELEESLKVFLQNQDRVLLVNQAGNSPRWLELTGVPLDLGATGLLPTSAANVDEIRRLVARREPEPFGKDGKFLAIALPVVSGQWAAVLMRPRHRLMETVLGTLGSSLAATLLLTAVILAGIILAGGPPLTPHRLWPFAGPKAHVMAESPGPGGPSAEPRHEQPPSEMDREPSGKPGASQPGLHPVPLGRLTEANLSSEERHRQAVEASDVGIWDWDMAAGEVWFSHRWASMLGCIPEELEPRLTAWTERIHPEDAPEVKAALDAHLRGETPFFESNHRLRHREAQWVWVQAKGRVTERDARGAPLRMVGTHKDISLQRDMENALAESEHRYRSIVEALNRSGEGLMLIDESHVIRYMNPIFEEWVGNGVGECCFQLLEGRATPCEGCELGSWVKGGVTVYRLWSIAGPRVLEVMTTGVPGPHGQRQILKIVRDVTLRQNTEDDLRLSKQRLQQQVQEKEQDRIATLNMLKDLEVSRQLAEEARQVAEKASKAKGYFLANMSHELRTPLHTMVGMTWRLRQEPLSTLELGIVKRIESSVEHMTALVDDLLNYSRLEHGQLELERVPFDLDTTLTRFADSLALAAEDKGLELVMRVAPNVPMLLKGDTFRLGQVLENLGSNAVKFSKRGEIVLTVDLEKQEGAEVTLRFTMRDQGIGMSEEALTELFQPFHQADPGVTRQYGGSGLGLAIAKNLVTLMGGSIWATSQLGVGSTFTFLARFGIESPIAEPPLLLPPRYAGARVLVVDDSQAARDALSTQLTALQIPHECVSSGEEALDRVGRHDTLESRAPVWLILLDHQLPGLSGANTARAIRAIWPGSVPKLVVVCPELRRERAAAQLTDVSIQGWLNRPASWGALRALFLEQSGLKRSAGTRTDRGPRPRRAPQRMTDKKILVVEDQAANREILQEILSLHGFQVETASNGEEAVQQVKSHPSAFAAVLMDIQMPVMGGYEATQCIHELEQARQLPIIAMTAYALKEEEARGLEAGMIAYVTKPLQVARLLEVLAKVLTGSPDTSVTSERSQPPDGASRLLSQQAAGLNLADALQRIGYNEAVYWSTLQRFVIEKQVTLAELEEALARGDRLEAARLSHAMGGVAGNLGAEALAAACLALEQDARSTDRPLDGHFVSVRDALLQVRTSVNELALSMLATEGPSSQPPPPDGPVNVAELVAELEALKSLFSKRDMAAQGILDRLSGDLERLQKGSFATLKDLEFRLEYAQAASVVHDMLEQLKVMQESASHA